MVYRLRGTGQRGAGQRTVSKAACCTESCEEQCTSATAKTCPVPLLHCMMLTGLFCLISADVHAKASSVCTHSPVGVVAATHLVRVALAGHVAAVLIKRP